MLQVLLAAATGLLLWGLARLWLDGVTHAMAMAAFAQLDSIPRLVAALLRAEPVALLCGGIALLAVTPALRLLLLLLDFALQRDWTYVIMCVLVGAIITVGFALRLH